MIQASHTCSYRREVKALLDLGTKILFPSFSCISAQFKTHFDEGARQSQGHLVFSITTMAVVAIAIVISLVKDEHEHGHENDYENDHVSGYEHVNVDFIAMASQVVTFLGTSFLKAFGKVELGHH